MLCAGLSAVEDIVNKFLHRETARENLEAQMHVCREKIDILTAERKGLLHRLENVQTDRSHMGGRVVYQELENTNRRLAVVRVATRHRHRLATPQPRTFVDVLVCMCLLRRDS